MKTVVEKAKTISRKRYGDLNYDFTEGYIIGANDTIENAIIWILTTYWGDYIDEEGYIDNGRIANDLKKALEE